MSNLAFPPGRFYLHGMPIVWDAPLVSSVARELDSLLRDNRLRAHRFHWDRRELTLFFRSGVLTWHLHPRDGRVVYRPAGESSDAGSASSGEGRPGPEKAAASAASEDPGNPPDDSRPLQCRVQGVTAPPDERILRMDLRRVRGRKLSLQVVVELMTNQWNALLLEGADGIIRHLLWTRRMDDRTLAVGQPYHPPEPSERTGVDRDLPRQEWEEIVSGGARGDRERALLGRLAFTSPVNLPALREAEPAEGHRLWRRLRTLSPPEPCLLKTTYGNQPYPIVLPGFEYVRFNQVLEAMSEAGGKEERGVEGKKEVILKHLEKALKRARGKRKGLAREMEEAGDPASVRDRANLLLARLHQVPKGADRIVLTGFRGEEVEVSLDPALPPQENAELLYEEAARLERVRDRLPALVKETEEEIRKLEALRRGLVDGSVHPRDVPSTLLPEAREEKGAPKEKDERLPYDRYRSSGGIEIRVGRGSKDNDDLTFHHSDPDDVWLHARQAAGAHVILRWTRKGAPPTRDLAEAGVLAALHSRARNAGTVPVDWTRRKYVRKPRKAPPGAVVPDRIRTIFVEPDPELPGRLRRRA